jgi:PIN domain nuclease of toxin-antitoxin system
MMVFDASALLIFLRKKPGYAKVASALGRALETRTPCLVSAVNWGEVIAVSHRHFGPAGATTAEQTMDELPLSIVAVDRLLAYQAARYKATRSMSYADCVAAALAKARKLPLMTSDPEFKAVDREIRITWL